MPVRYSCGDVEYIIECIDLVFQRKAWARNRNVDIKSMQTIFKVVIADEIIWLQRDNGRDLRAELWGKLMLKGLGGEEEPEKEVQKEHIR